MRKIENGRTLCDYYNEIVYKVNQLTEMCGNTDKAIKLRDDIFDMFTVKFSEPLDEVSDLQDQIGCSFETVVKAFQKYVGWTTDCDFGYDNIPDEYETYKDDDKFKTLTYDSGLIYIAIQETLKESKGE